MILAQFNLTKPVKLNFEKEEYENPIKSNKYIKASIASHTKSYIMMFQ